MLLINWNLLSLDHTKTLNKNDLDINYVIEYFANLVFLQI